MNADGRDGIHVMETEKIIGCAFAVLNTLGHGFHEKPYEQALAVEFGHQGIPYAQQARFPIQYRSVKVGEYIPDLVVFERVIVDTKTIDRISDLEVGRMLNYLRATGLQVGLILNFKYAKLQFRRVTLTSPSAPDLHS
ncbi:MAG: GxxExxY protein [Verrucomicrobiaceae bacterium]|nr:MAG: GxxExxY protein [Verrucomicrobiaceae bacterium]